MDPDIIADDGVHRPGKLYVVGGSSDRPAPLQTCEFFNDLGGTKKLPANYPSPFSLHPIAHLHQKRSAPGVARDHEDGVWAVGGWSGSAALNTVERLGVNVQEMMTTRPSADTINWTQDMFPRMKNVTMVRNATTLATKSSSSTTRGGSSSSSNEQISPPTTATTLCRREAQWNEKQELQTARCFLASITDLQGRLYALGGGESIWQGARVFNTTEVLDDPLASPSACAWRSGPAMVEARCGLSAALDIHGHIYVAGGYGGGTRYSSSVEVLRVGDASEGATRGWLADVVPPMQVARTGFGLAFGPDRCLVAVGGSPDGLHSHRTAERYDDREGRWRWLPRMMTPRGYCAVAFGTSGLLYVVGGEDGNENARNRVVEIFDPRAGRWRAWVGPGDPGKDGVDRVDLGVVWALV